MDDHFPFKGWAQIRLMVDHLDIHGMFISIKDDLEAKSKVSDWGIKLTLA
jgi:hypothetical protein